MFGPHVNRYHATGKRPDISAHIEAARREAVGDADFRIGAISLFVSEVKGALKTNLHPGERTLLKNYLVRTGIRAIAHSTYQAYPWGGNPASAAFICEELKVCQEAGIEGLVVHLPKAPIETVMKYIHRLFEPTVETVRIYLETPAVVPKESYYDTPVKLATLFAAIRTVDPDLARFGLCVDTSHLWVNGNDLQSFAAGDAWFRGLEEKKSEIPHNCVILHLNDSVTARGHGPDKHAGLGMGRIWEKYLTRALPGGIPASGLAAIVDYARRHGTPVILERKPKEALRLDYKILGQLAPECRASQPDTADTVAIDWSQFDDALDELLAEIPVEAPAEDATQARVVGMAELSFTDAGSASALLDIVDVCDCGSDT
jgi:endonuclease IV